MKRALIPILLWSLAVPAGAQETSPQTAPLPKQRPEVSEGGSAPLLVVPIPEARPDDLEVRTDGKATDPSIPSAAGPPRIILPDEDGQNDMDEAAAESTSEEEEDVAATPPVPEQLAVTDAEFATCRTALDALGTTYEVVDPVANEKDADCGIQRPIEVTEIVPGVALIPSAPMRCDTALSLAEWVEGFAIPATERLERGALTEIRQGTGYLCRHRNNDPSEVLSEHAFGNAVDIMSFGFADGSDVAVQPREREGSLAEAFQDAVRATACLEFATVLGPGTDAAHADHLHLDVKQRNGGFRLCQ